LHAYYGKSHVLQNVSIDVERGEVVALLGRNGSGRSTTLKAIMGLVPARTGSIRFKEQSIAGRPAFALAKRGIAFVPEDRRIFPNLTVFENLKLAQVTARQEGWRLDRVYEHFPRLRERLGHKGDEISGGEKQMLAIARALLQAPTLLLLDEPTEGLAPLIVKEVENIVCEIKASKMTTLLVEQNLQFAAALAERAYIMNKGVVVRELPIARIVEDPEIQREYMGV